MIKILKNLNVIIFINLMFCCVSLSADKNIFDTLKIKFGYSDYQDVVPGKKFSFRLESIDYDIKSAIGEIGGFQRLKICKGLNISNSRTDSFHIYYDYKLKHLIWWRL